MALNGNGGEMRIIGPWSLTEIKSYLDGNVIPIRLGVHGGRNYPIVASLWFLRKDLTIVCSSQKKSRIVECLEKQPVCGFEIAGDTPPYHGVRGQGDVVLSSHNSRSNLKDLTAKYLEKNDQKLQEWLLSRSDAEVTITISPSYLTSWDYRQRMATGTA